MPAAALVLSGCTGVPRPEGSGSSLPMSPYSYSTSANPTISNAPLETAQSASKTPVYWLGRSNDAVNLYREFLDVPDHGDPISSALWAMMSQRPADPEYFTAWQRPTRLGASISGKNLITVDVSHDAFGGDLDAGMAQRAVQQLVFTATAAAGAAGLVDSNEAIQVVVLVDGHTDYAAFGHVKLGQPMLRDSSLQAPVWIIDPQEGSQVPDGHLKITGRGVSPTSTLSWQILKLDGNGSKNVYLSGSTQLNSPKGQMGDFAVTVNLAPGKYEVRVFQPSPGPAQLQQNVDSKSITVK
ncbi:GerMN domain-containing protein [Paenarthrobacter sp. DKR-5]|uniref:GerMN domain-containing protein n=1 Tax=Paenarthrobacter sp. DKR-5 TaxID=2835535 RepID=UPI0027DBA98C|nr:GerMN domain-containing protein [Paenarthrobacter sp. DKR-5]